MTTMTLGAPRATSMPPSVGPQHKQQQQRQQQQPSRSVSCNSRSTVAASNTTGAIVQRKVALMEKQSKLKAHSVPTITWESIRLREKVGTGVSCQVLSADVATSHQSPSSTSATRTMAVKALRPQVFKESPQHIETSAADLATEASILSKLDHPNIIKLHATSKAPLDQAFHQPSGYFLVLDLLSTTLAHKLAAWRNDKSRADLAKPQILQRIEEAGLSVAMGMHYLHSKDIVMRDLKPSNVGFDQHGNVKIFDLGLAREVHVCPNHEMAGSLRYMAPEMSRGHKADLKADVYSFGVLLYELCTLQKPFTQFKSTDAFREKVVDKDWRPSLRAIPSGTLRRLIAACWDRQPNTRPNFAHIVSTLTSLLEKNDEEFDIHSVMHRGPVSAPSPVRCVESQSVVRKQPSFVTPPMPTLKENVSACYTTISSTTAATEASEDDHDDFEPRAASGTSPLIC